MRPSTRRAHRSPAAVSRSGAAREAHRYQRWRQTLALGRSAPSGALPSAKRSSLKVDLEGRKSGPLSGFLLITARDNTNDLELWSDNIDNLLGVVYAPGAKQQVDGKEQVAEDSDWTVVVAKTIELKGSASLKLNTNYTSSLVPVPEGVGPNTAVRLTQ
jgi:hypothetical protein